MNTPSAKLIRVRRVKRSSRAVIAQGSICLSSTTDGMTVMVVQPMGEENYFLQLNEAALELIERASARRTQQPPRSEIAPALTRETAQAIEDAPFLAESLRQDAAACRNGHEVNSTRLLVAASSLESLLRERAELLKRLELAEFAARQNGATVASMQRAGAPA